MSLKSLKSLMSFRSLVSFMSFGPAAILPYVFNLFSPKICFLFSFCVTLLDKRFLAKHITKTIIL